MVYADGLLFVGETEEINNIFNKIQEKMLLRATGEASPGNTFSCLGRRITNKGDHFDISLDDEYVDNISLDFGIFHKSERERERERERE